MPQDPYAAIAQPMAADPYAVIAQPSMSLPNVGLAPAAGGPAQQPVSAPTDLLSRGVGTGNDLASRAATESSAAYHNPLEALKGAAKGTVGAAGAVIPSLQSDPNLAQRAQSNPYISTNTKKLLASEPEEHLRDLSGGIVSGVMQPQNPAQQGGHDLASIIATARGAYETGKGLQGILGMSENPARIALTRPTKIVPNAEPHDLTSKTYSPAGDKIAASMRSNSAVDLPAEAHNAMPALKEAAADRGITAADFKGRNGPTAYQAVNKHALDITEARAKLAIDPVRDTEVLPDTLAKNPALAAQFSPEELKRGLTIDDIDAKRVALNKQLRTSNFYSKAPSAQYAVADPMAAIHDAANQARTLVYDTASKATGVDLRPLKSTESSLIKLNDVANSTKNTLTEQTAKQNAAPMLQKIVGGAKRLIAIKANPTNAFEPGIVDPTADFNRNMQSAFSDVKASPGSVMKNGRLLEAGPGVLTKPPGVTPPEVNRQLPLTLEPNAPGYELTPPGGKTPPEIQPRQAAIPLDHGYHDVPGKDLHLTPPPPGEVGPTPLQNLLDFSREAHPTSQAGVPKSLGAAAAEPAGTPVPDILKPALNGAGEVTWPDSYKNPPKGGGGNYGPSDLDALKKRMGLTSEVGAERRTNPRNVLMSPAEIEAAIKNRMPVTTPFDMTEGANETIKNDPLMPRHPSELLQGGHAGNGVTSVEELSRPGANYVVDGHGKLTFHGKSFAPEETPVGSAHVTVLPDGELRINEGNLTPQMTAALRDGLKK